MSDIITKTESPVNALLWTREEEELLKDWSDIANRFRWLHERSAIVYKNKNNKIALPVIMISTLTGTANFGINSLVPAEFIQTAQVVIGGANIFCGILTTIQTYFKYAENSEAHQNASKMWAKFQSIIAIELAIEPSKRKHPTVFLKFCIEEYNKLKEYSPQIPPQIASAFKTIFRKKNLKLPDIYDEINPTLTYNDYVSRNIRSMNNKEDISVPKTPSSFVDSEGGSNKEDIEAGLRRFPSAIPPKPVRELAKKFNKFPLDLDETSGISIELKKKEVEKCTTNQKDNIKNELENIRPAVQGLITNFHKTLENTLSSKINEVNKESNISEDTNSNRSVRGSRSGSIILNNNESSKNNLKNI